MTERAKHYAPMRMFLPARRHRQPAFIDADVRARCEAKRRGPATGKKTGRERLVELETPGCPVCAALIDGDGTRARL